MEELKNSILAGFFFGVCCAILFMTFESYDWRIAMVIGLASGLFFGLAMYFFATSKEVKEQTKLAVDKKEILHSGGANHFQGYEAVGGKLYLLKDQLIFKSHRFNFQNHELNIDMKNIQNVDVCSTIGLVPNGLKVIMTDGKEEQFVVNKRNFWKEKINEIKKNS